MIVGEVLDIHINKIPLSSIPVKGDFEAEFEHWSDGEVSFPQITEGDKVDIIYQSKVVISGVFRKR